MRLSFQLVREDPGDRQPVSNGSIDVDDSLLSSVILHMSLWPPAGNIYHFHGNATLSFIGGQLIDEHCRVLGCICWYPNQTTYHGWVTYINSQSLIPVDDEGLTCSYIGQIEFPGPRFHSNPHIPAVQQRLIQPTLQQQQNQEMLYVRGHNLIMTVFSLVIAQENWP